MNDVRAESQTPGRFYDKRCLQFLQKSKLNKANKKDDSLNSVKVKYD